MFDNKYLIVGIVNCVFYSGVSKDDPFDSLHKCQQFP